MYSCSFEGTFTDRVLQGHRRRYRYRHHLNSLLQLTKSYFIIIIIIIKAICIAQDR